MSMKESKPDTAWLFIPWEEGLRHLFGHPEQGSVFCDIEQNLVDVERGQTERSNGQNE